MSLTFLVSCQSNKSEPINYIANIENGFIFHKEVHANVLFNQIEIIELDSITNTKINIPNAIAMNDSVIYMYDPMVKIIIKCNIAGQYLSTISKMGRGPGEFVVVSSITVLNDGSVLISDPIQKKILKFDASSNFEYSVKTSFRPYGIYELDQNKFLVTSIFNQDSLAYHMALVNDQYEILKYLYPTGPRARRRYHINTYEYEDRINLWDGIKNELYSVDDQLSFHLRYKLVFPKQMDSTDYFTLPDSPFTIKGNSIIRSIHESPSYLFLYGLMENEIKHIVFNKMTAESYYCKFLYGEKELYGIKNHALFDLPTWPYVNVLDDKLMSFESINNNQAVVNNIRDFGEMNKRYLIIYQE